MIKTFKCKETQKIWAGETSRKFPNDIQDRALRKLRQLDAASSIDSLKNPPSNHLEGLIGNRRGHMSIRVNNQWRICFKWEDGEVSDIEIIDYH
jgi:proteic killer suppression protein